MRLLVLALCMAAAAPAAADTVMVEAGRDATMIEDAAGSRANGSGPGFFAGRTSQPADSIRRGLIFFDVAGALPTGAIVEQASLELHALPGNPAPRVVGLYRVLASWEEGASYATGGGGAPAETGDVTWIHTSYDTEFWVRPGGHFVPRVSAEAVVSDTGSYTWDGAGASQDVALWARAPLANQGWILIGDETMGQTAKVFASREVEDASLRPRLRISYRMPGELPEP